MDILIIGLGYVGLVTGTCFAEMGHHVTCLDIDQDKISQLKKGKLPFYEPGLAELLLRNQKEERLFFTTSYQLGIKEAQLAFIAVGTPPLEDGSADLSQVKEAVTHLANAMEGECVIVNKSTVPVGTTRQLKKHIQAILDQREVTFSFDVISNPEFLKEGSAIEDCMKPDRIIIGSDSEDATKLLQTLYSSFTVNHNRILLMGFESAEMTKYASNAMLATRISFMNELSILCEKMGASIKDVRTGMSTDQRIGYHFLYAGVGYGGSCFPKDIRALQAMATKLKCPTPILEGVEKVNENQKHLFSKKITKYFANKGGIRGKTVAIWGLSYKPNTDDIREAPALTLIDSLRRQGAHLRLYDPLAMDNAKKWFDDHTHIHFCLSEYHAAHQADAIVLMTEWKQFRFVNLKAILMKMRGNAFFDGRNQYQPKEMAHKGFWYFGIGIPPLPIDLLKERHTLDKKKAQRYAVLRLDQSAPFFD